MDMELLLLYSQEIFTQLLVPVIYAFLACIGFGILFNIRDVDLLLSAIGGAFAWMCYLIVVHYFNDILACFVGGFAISLFSEVLARLRRTPSTCFLIIGLLPLVPGAGVYYTMKFFVQGQYSEFAEKGVSTLACAGAIALGVMWVISMVRIQLHISALRRQKKLQQN